MVEYRVWTQVKQRMYCRAKEWAHRCEGINDTRNRSEGVAQCQKEGYLLISGGRCIQATGAEQAAQGQNR